MSTPPSDKSVECERYDRRAAQVLAGPGAAALPAEGAGGIPVTLRAPYLVYEKHVLQHARPGVCVLDLCCGNGQHSLLPARLGAIVTVSDIAPSNVELTVARGRAAGLPLTGVVADAEKLPFPNQSFDVVMVAGSISYVDFDAFFADVRRVLRPGGVFLFVDSLNHNPVYRFNRWRHYRRGELTPSILRRMPTVATLDRIRQDFPDLQVSFHGIFSFMIPVLRPLGEERAASLLDAMDLALPWAGRFGFKVVGAGRMR